MWRGTITKISRLKWYVLIDSGVINIWWVNLPTDLTIIVFRQLLQGVMVRALPTLIFYSNGSPLATHSGAITESGLEEWLAEGFAKMEGLELESEVAKQSATVATASSIMKEEEQQPPKRGFISFGAQVDDYALGM